LRKNFFSEEKKHENLIFLATPTYPALARSFPPRPEEEFFGFNVSE
jgi:hypothetical protein